MTVTIFGSAFIHPTETLYSDALKIGEVLAEKNISVCSGGYAGIMEAVSEGAFKYKCKITGVTVELD